MSWNRKYRPHTVAGLHLTIVREKLAALMKSGQLPRAFLFAGPKGTGKTSTSRIIGAVLNDSKNEALVDYIFFGKEKPKQKKLAEPTSTKSSDRIFDGTSFVVQEMDAASHRGIDDVRSLREKISLPPQTGKVSVIILDEAHMLTREAFNALLKVLEEPPKHVVFILATTQLEKIPDTVVSRCLLLRFSKASVLEINSSLANIAKKEKLKFEPEALVKIAEQADGSFRDAVKQLEFVAQTGLVTTQRVEELIGSASLDQAHKLISAVVAKDEKSVVNQITELRKTNSDPVFFLKQVVHFLHHTLLQTLEVEKGEPAFSRKVAQFLLEQLSDSSLLAPSPLPFLSLELKLLGLIERSKRSPGGSAAKTNSKSQNSVNKIVRTEKISAKPEIKESAVELVEESIVEKIVPLTALDFSEILSKWGEIVEVVAKKNATIAALLRSAKLLDSDEGVARVGVYYRFHQEQLQQPKFLGLIQDCVQSLLGTRVPLEFVLAEAPKKAELIETPAPVDELTTAVEKFLH